MTNSKYSAEEFLVAFAPLKVQGLTNKQIAQQLGISGKELGKFLKDPKITDNLSEALLAELKKKVDKGEITASRFVELAYQLHIKLINQAIREGQYNKARKLAMDALKVAELQARFPTKAKIETSTPRKKGDPGTKAYLNQVSRRNYLKERLTKNPNIKQLAEELGVDRRTVHRDIKAIQTETLKKLKEISKEEIFLEFLTEMNGTARELIMTIQDTWRNIEDLDASQRGSLYNVIVNAVRTHDKNRAMAIRIGQTLGIYPMTRPGIDIHISYEEKREFILQVIESVAYPALMKYIPNEEDQRHAAREIDQRATQLLSLPGPEGTGQEGQEFKRGRPRHSS